MGRAVFGEGRFELGERLFGHAASDAIVGIDDDLLLLLRLGVAPFDLNVRLEDRYD